MKRADQIPNKIFELSAAIRLVAQWRVKGKTIAFTNGFFDLLHEGHIYSLSQAAAEADYLIVGINSDALASLVMVDAVIIFEEDTPFNLINQLLPDVLVKGGDYTLEQIVGANEVMANGGRIVINKMVEGFSTTGIIDKLK